VGRLAAIAWKNEGMPRLRFVRASLVLDRPRVFPKAKDRSIVLTALAARSDWLLTPMSATSTRSLGARFTACASPRRASFC